MYWLQDKGLGGALLGRMGFRDGVHQDKVRSITTQNWKTQFKNNSLEFQVQDFDDHY